MFRGSIVALVTPFRNGDVDDRALGDLVEWHIAEGTHGIVPVGTTGESPTLTHREHEGVVERVVEATAGRVPVIAGAGSNSTHEAVAFVRFAAKVGADAGLVVTPYYNKPTQEGLFQHFKTVHDAADLPLLVYNIPGRSVVDMAPATMGRLAELPNIVGVKDATADLARPLLQARACGDGFCQLSGEDGTALAFNAQGGVGCISVTANVAPRRCAHMQAAWLDGEPHRALALQRELMPLHTALFCESSPAPTKYALSRLGRCTDEVRLPLVPLSANGRERVDAALAEVVA
ncbi:MAG: 4-hydroxy-tetrahydrodipicolinate synthase [Alphaproteobacteria bacterium]|jgi:4-hydroxy-tetrahydrodipicolinate synthase|nr:4-hydroxy-tetrahydrodipicolinate synthase [Alphaproteobacteria bacterium]